MSEVIAHIGDYDKTQ